MNALPAKIPHKSFSPSRIFAIAGNTLRELVRLKVFYFLLIFALLVAVVFGFSSILDFPFQQQLGLVKDVSLGAMSIFTLLLAVFVTSTMLPKDVEDRTLYTILAKPVPRFDYIVGKLLGMYMLLFICMAVMCAMFAIGLYVKEEMVISVNKAFYDNGHSDKWPAVLADIQSHGFTPSLVPCIILLYVEAVLMATLTMMVSTFSTSYIFTLFISFTAYFIGNIEGGVRDYLMETGNPGAFMKFFTGIVALVFPDLQLFNLVDDVVAGNVIAFNLFYKTAALGCGYIFVYGLIAYVIFWYKEL